MEPQYLVLVRHGETEANLSGIIQGRKLDLSMTKRGRRQAKVCGKLLRSRFSFEHLISSPLLRARETARLLCRSFGLNEAEIEIDENLSERSYGDLASGKRWSECYDHPVLGKEIQRLRRIWRLSSSYLITLMWQFLKRP